MSAELTALALVRQAITAPGTVTDTVLMEAAMGSDDPLQHQLDITNALVRTVSTLLKIAGGSTERALILINSIETEYKDGP